MPATLPPNKTGAAASSIACRGISHGWTDAKGEEYRALSGIDFSIAPGEFVSIIGPSGSGKTTLLRIIAGLQTPTAGTVQIDGAALVEGTRREVGMVFQEASLFPWLNALDNVGFGPMLDGVSKRERRAEAQKWLDKVGLAAFGGYYPYQLSGGMKQRVAIARALANGAQILLMDEPFAALDYQVRRQMQTLLLDLWGHFKKTVVFVTHHIDEAVLLSDRIMLMTAGPEARIAEILDITLPRPRTLQAPELQQICTDVIAHVEEQGVNR